MTVLLTEEHLRKIIEYELLKEDEISDLANVKVAGKRSHRFCSVDSSW